MMESQSPPLLVPRIFFPTLAVTLAVAALALLGARWAFGSLPVRDIVGTGISAPIFAYMVHLWIVIAKDSHEGE